MFRGSRASQMVYWGEAVRIDYCLPSPAGGPPGGISSIPVGSRIPGHWKRRLTCLLEAPAALSPAPLRLGILDAGDGRLAVPLDLLFVRRVQVGRPVGYHGGRGVGRRALGEGPVEHPHVLAGRVDGAVDGAVRHPRPKLLRLSNVVRNPSVCREKGRASPPGFPRRCGAARAGLPCPNFTHLE